MQKRTTAGNGSPSSTGFTSIWRYDEQRRHDDHDMWESMLRSQGFLFLSLQNPNISQSSCCPLPPPSPPGPPTSCDGRVVTNLIGAHGKSWHGTHNCHTPLPRPAPLACSNHSIANHLCCNCCNDHIASVLQSSLPKTRMAHSRNPNCFSRRTQQEPSEVCTFDEGQRPSPCTSLF